MTNELKILSNFLKKFDHQIEEGRENYEWLGSLFDPASDDQTEDLLIKDCPYIRFNRWLTIYHHENTFFVNNLTSEDSWDVFRSTSFHETIEYAGFRIIEWEAQCLADHLADEAMAEFLADLAKVNQQENTNV